MNTGKQEGRKAGKEKSFSHAKAQRGKEEKEDEEYNAGKQEIRKAGKEGGIEFGNQERKDERKEGKQITADYADKRR